MPVVVICDPIAEGGLALLESGAEVVDVCALDREGLLEEVARADALIVRSSTKIDAGLIEAAPNLRVIARAGVGVDNIDLDAATRRGIAVVNTPTGNTVAAAEHTMAMMLALARRIPAADAALKSGRWAKKDAVGRQLYRKRLGIIGFGKIGQEVARRARAFEMRLLVHDPFVPAERIREQGAEVAGLDELLSESEVVTLHATLTDETYHLIGARELEMMRRGALLINCARGALIDEAALQNALVEGIIGGAALDVFENEPEPHPDLLPLDNVIVTPHVAASTEEAQALVSREAVEQVLEVLAGGRPRWPVNIPALTREEIETVSPYLPLAESLGRVQAALLEGPAERAAVYAGGSEVEEHLRIIGGHFLVGLLAPLCDEPVNYVNAAVVAAERGLQVSRGAAADTRGYSRYLSTEVTRGGRQVAVAGALLDRAQARIVEVAGFGLDLVPEDTVLLIWNARPELPGFVGTIGRILGEADISILGIQVGRGLVAGCGLMAVSVAGLVERDVLRRIRELEMTERLEMVAFAGDPAAGPEENQEESRVQDGDGQ